MRQIKAFFSNKMVLFSILFIMVVTAAVSFGFKRSQDRIQAPAVTEITGNQGPGGAVKGPAAVPSSAGRKASVTRSNDLSKLVLNVGNMSCSGCIATIKSSIAGFQEIKETLVDVGGGRVEIYYDGEKLKNVTPIVDAITAGGYPARVLKNYSPEEVKKERALVDARSKYYVASVSGWDIARADFDTELASGKKRYQKIYGDHLFTTPQGEALVGNLKAQIISKLIDEGIIMQEIVKSGFKVDPENVGRAMQDFLKDNGKTLVEFKESLNEIGYDYDYFRRKFEIKILINQYINGRVLAGATNDFEKQNLFNAWFKNTKVLAEVIYYDRDLERLVQALSASGGCSASG